MSSTRIALLIFLGVGFTLLSQVVAEDFYIDNSDPFPRFQIVVGDWYSVNASNAYNGETRFCYPRSYVNYPRIAAWNIQNYVYDGNYDVYIWKFDHPFLDLMCNNAMYLVSHISGGSDPIYVDLSTPSSNGVGEWVYLGNYGFNSSHAQGVGVLGSHLNGFVIADAAYFQYTGPLGSAPPPDSLRQPPDIRDAVHLDPEVLKEMEK